jgi:hypothetical protein
LADDRINFISRAFRWSSANVEQAHSGLIEILEPDRAEVVDELRAEQDVLRVGQAKGKLCVTEPEMRPLLE